MYNHAGEDTGSDWMTKVTRDEVRSFLIGTLLGDCYASPTYQWQWSNTEQNYVEWKASFIRRYLGASCSVLESKDSTCANGFMYRFALCSNKGRLRIYRNWFYAKDGKKHITKRIRHFDHPLGLAVLILDQGSCRGGLTKDYKTGNTYYRKPTVRIHLNAYPEEELVLFQQALKTNFDLTTTLQKKRSGKSDGLIDVYFGTTETQKLWTLIKPWVPDLVFARKKFHPLIIQTTNAKYVQRQRGCALD
jgi:hypothetical protein